MTNSSAFRRLRRACGSLLLTLLSVPLAAQTFTWNGTSWSPSVPTGTANNATYIFQADYSGAPQNFTANGGTTRFIVQNDATVNLGTIGTPTNGAGNTISFEGTGTFSVSTITLNRPNSAIIMDSDASSPVDNLVLNVGGVTSIDNSSSITVDRGSVLNANSGITKTGGGGGSITIGGQGQINGNCPSCACTSNCPQCSTNPSCPGGSVPLPVSLVQFVGEREGSAVLLSWATASEDNASHFEVQRSREGRTFQAIGRVEAAGNSRTLRSYSFTDAEAGTSRVFYRLRQLDLDGTEHFSVVIELGGFSNPDPWVVYPNPVTGPVQITLVTERVRPQDPHLLRVYNVQGQLLTTVRGDLGQVRERVNQVLTNAAPGVYLLQLESQAHAQQLRVVRP